MAVEIQFKSGSESITEGTLGRWLKQNGEAVQKDEVIAEIETDKVNEEVYAPQAGVLTTLVPEGAKITKGQVIAHIDPSAKPAAAPKKEEKAAQPVAAAAPSKNAPTPMAPKGARETKEVPASPAARHVAANEDVDLNAVEGSGRGGRVIKEDVLEALQKRATPAPPPTTGDGQKQEPPIAQPVSANGRGERRVPMSTLRQRVAQRLLEAQSNAAILTTFNEADMTAVMELRAKYKEAFSKKHGVGLGFMSFFVKTVCEAVKAFPAVNARIQGTDIVYHDYCDIGVAVSTEKGLMVPIVRNAERMSFAQIEKAIAELAARGREGKLKVPDLEGGTFTITNGGIFGSLLSTPILNPPQSAILGMHAIQKRPVALNDQVVIRPMMYLALSYDHRIIDGREAVSFLVRVKECIESPERILLEM